MIFRSCIHSFITTNKLRLGAVVGIIGDEDFSINVVVVFVVVAVGFFFLLLQDRTAFELCEFSLKQK